MLGAKLCRAALGGHVKEPKAAPLGFRTLAIEKRSSEVWQVLGAAKAEFKKYGDVWDKLSKQLATAQNTVTEAGKRTRAVERKLRDVESLELPGGVDVFDALPDLEPTDDQDRVTTASAA